MAVAGQHIEDSDGGSASALAGVAGALVVFAAFLAVAMSRNGWSFEYPLDDVYIHLAMAEQIAAGGYGVNAGEFASAASSPFYPFLLALFADSSIQRWLPLFWNVASLAAASALFGVAMARAGLKKVGVVLAAVAPLALATYITAFTGMENMAHVAASLAVVLGLWGFVRDGRIGWLLLAGVFLSSAFRLEGLALGFAAGGVIAVLGNIRGGLAVAAIAVAPVAIFALFLLSLGLDPLPNSVLAKLGDTGGGSPLAKFAANTQVYGGRHLLVLSAAVGLVGTAILVNTPRVGYFALAVATAGLAQLTFGSVGWMDRYESYAVVSLTAALALVLSGVQLRFRATAVAAALAGSFLTYAPYALSVYAWNPAAIAQQQGQMARFAKEFVHAPVAVNDIGHVSWRNPDYVLDLWGLASHEALELRRKGEPGWAGAIATSKGVEVAMVYDRWLGEAVPESWTRLGTLHLDVPRAFLGGADVEFYATSPDVAPLQDALDAWIEGLPSRASFKFAEDGS